MTNATTNLRPVEDREPGPRPGPLPDRPPGFLVGCVRSGTTMLRLMLDHHPEIAFSSEFEYAVDLVPDEGWPELDAYYEFLETDRIFQDSGQRIVPGLDYPALVRDFLRQFQERRGKPIVHTHFDWLPRIWPDARYLHLVRDGRDVARSIIAMGWAGTFWTAAERWVEAERLWDRLKPTLAPDQVLEVRYEELVAAPEPQLTRICEFLGVAYRPEMLEFPKHSSYSAPDPQLSYQWKKKLTPDQLREVEAQLGPLLTEGRGYEPSGQPPLEVSASMARRLHRLCRLARARNRVKFLGPGLFLASYISRRIGPKAWRDGVQRRVNRKVRASLK